ncbi:MAG TPA: radical SAM family heme chaperone HemW [Terriglobia bacterium]|nr:radical SAM family heme chaperone HemW [Terriglobia bacterium]
MSLIEKAKNTLGVYVQVPFCASKCSFCNFSSQVAPLSVFDAYCRALLNEIEMLPRVYSREGIAPTLCTLKVDTVYFGGGTPSLLGSPRLRRLVQALRARFQFVDTSEVTLEAAPGSVDEAFCDSTLELGINRLSIGAQSFNDRELSSTGRLHSSAETQALVHTARRAGFSNISIDLMAGLPYQTKPSWLASVGEALKLEPEHISIYLFEVDEKSRLGSEVIHHGSHLHADTVPDDDFMAAAYEKAQELLAGQGYVQYEISNFALPGRESRHNQKYWRLEPYVGLGAGAHSFDGAHRWANVTEVETYQGNISRGDSPITEHRLLSAGEQLEEFFFLGLRQKNGVDLQTARRKWGELEVGQWEPKLSNLARQGWIDRRDDRIFLPASAYLVSNEIFQEFIVK